MSQWIEVAGAVLATIGLGAAAVALAGVAGQRDEALATAEHLAQCLRGLDAWPVVEHRMLESVGLVGEATSAVVHNPPRESRFTVVPMPVSVAVIGRSAQVDRWSVQTAAALRRLDLLKEER